MKSDSARLPTSAAVRPRRVPGRFWLAGLLCMLALPAGAAPASRDARFDAPLNALRAGSADAAAAGFFAYAQSAEEGETREWARLLLGVALGRLGLTHAAVQTFIEVGRNRAAPELLPAALREVLALRAAGPIVESEWLDRLVLDTDLGYLEPRLADEVHLQKGQQDYRNGDAVWAEREFARLAPDGYAAWKAEWVRALADVSQNRLAAAETRLLAILARLEGPTAPGLAAPASDGTEVWRPPSWGLTSEGRELAEDARRTLSRILYEQKRFREAADLLRPLQARSLVDGARLLLERAWCAYFLGDPRSVLGHLYALGAPSYREAFLPERFALAGLTYRNLCHHELALGVVQAFRAQFGGLVAQVRARSPIDHEPRVQRVVQADEGVRALRTVRDALLRERERARRIRGPLGAHLAAIYEAGVAALAGRLDRAERQVIADLTRQLFDYDEQMNLLEHEVGTEQFRRFKQADYLARGPAAAPPVPVWGEALYFRADGEYWNEELDLFRVHIDDRCERPRPWE